MDDYYDELDRLEQERDLMECETLQSYNEGYNEAINDIKEMLSGISYKLYELITDRLDELYKVV